VLTATGIFAYKLLNSTLRHFSRNTQKTSRINSSTFNKFKSYLVIIVCCCRLEFQFLSVPTHSRLPSQSTLPTLRSNLRSQHNTLFGERHQLVKKLPGPYGIWRFSKVNNTLPLISILRQINPVCRIPFYIFHTHFNIIFLLRSGLRSGFFPSGFRLKLCTRFWPFPCVLHASAIMHSLVKTH
jgi:hypothetical protein